VSFDLCETHALHVGTTAVPLCLRPFRISQHQLNALCTRAVKPVCREMQIGRRFGLGLPPAVLQFYTVRRRIRGWFWLVGKLLRRRSFRRLSVRPQHPLQVLTETVQAF
jgi:hypothetical protein